MIKFKNDREQAIIRLWQDKTHDSLFSYDDDYTPTIQDLYEDLLGDHFIYKIDLEMEITEEIKELQFERKLDRKQIG